MSHSDVQNYKEHTTLMLQGNIHFPSHMLEAMGFVLYLFILITINDKSHPPFTNTMSFNISGMVQIWFIIMVIKQDGHISP